ncbi:hypothetical protein TVAG_353840 [Trichomonas vaginalis G3]|uniref:Glycosyltransferase 61 catalytic domain-containing protein n=1 Tax=Trichomonas vaginalis (strain ATCC PRA-98 / G3) TaxID=412133 RepID=A2FDH6_TRIV3|nr:glycosyltransferase family [Trichomonas vaginalis G3]EAX97053.1 hypothetical protein TVAG_353840 [Trichomonas vaginalis G3]KAI5515729.1 glycosyltransferase family [Trichomonas vaginalis G3]|eukprot:XP_001309983.1 hypothetical protein [Trichomonas vaginalis G3]
MVPSTLLWEVRPYKSWDKLDYTLITEETPAYDSGVPHCGLMQSIIYISIYDHAFLSLDPRTRDFKVIQNPPYDSIDGNNRKTNGVYNIGLSFQQRYPQFGHLIHDMLCCLSYIPQEVIDQGCVAPGPWSGPHSAIQWIAFLKWNITLIDGYTHLQVYVNQLWSVNPTFHSHHATLGGIPNLRRRIRNIYPIEEIPAKRFVILKRTGRRAMSNYDALVASIKQNVIIDEGMKWEDLPFDSSNLTQVCFEWATYKVVVTVSGSMCYNSLFMHKNTGFCLSFSRKLDDPNIHLFIASEIFMAGVIHLNCDHNADRPFECDIEKMTKHTQQVVWAVQKGKWGNREGLRQFYNLTELKECPKHKIKPIYIDRFTEYET